MKVAPAEFAQNMAQTNDAALLRDRLSACQWFLSLEERRVDHLSAAGASAASIDAQWHSVKCNRAAINAIEAKLAAI